MPKQQKQLFHFAVAFSVLIFCFLVRRLFYGVDLTDEAFYCALAKTFSQGRRPFLDELLAVPTSAMTLVPLTRMFLFFSKAGDGIVLFFRLVYFAALITSCFFIFRRLKQHIGDAEALLTATLTMSFWPFALPTLSYNTLGTLFANFGLLTLLQIEEDGFVGWWFPVGLVFFALSSWCYPTFIIPSLIALMAAAYFLRDARWNHGALVTSAFIVVAGLSLAVYLIFFYIGLPRLQVIHTYVGSFNVHGGRGGKWLKIGALFKENFQFIAMVTVGTWVVVAATKRKWYLGASLAVVLILALFKYPETRFTMQPYHASVLALTLAGLPALLKFRRLNRFPILTLISVFAILFGVACAWSSSNGLTNFAVSSTIGLLGFGWYVADSFGGEIRRRWVCSLLLCCFCIFQVRHLYISIYADGPGFKSLNTMITDGPYMFLRTSSEKAEFLRSVAADLRETEIRARSIAFFETFAFGYLLTNLEMRAPTIWPYSLSQFLYDRGVIAEFYHEPKNRPDAIYWLNTQFVMPGYEVKLDNDLPDQMREELPLHYDLKVKRKYYSIYERRD